MKTTKFIWMDGKLVKWKNAKVHIMTHAIHYGSAVFEGIHAYETNKGTAIFRLDDHINRLFHSASALGMKLKFSKNQLKKSIKKLVKINNIGDGYIRPIAYYGYGNIGVYPKGIPANIAIITIPWGHYYSTNLRIKISEYRRHSERSSVYGAKISGNYANSILAMYEVRKKGYDEALMLDLDNYVSEGPAENIFMVKNKTLIAPKSRSALPGITRKSILEISKGIGIKAYEKKVRAKELKNADELFFCGTATEIAPVIAIDGKRVGNGKAGEITLKIRQKYRDVVRGKDKKYMKWLAYIG
ncbi:branched-chain amino acid transaminase [Candidatus Woesearchaeota archaeon]|nr:branched-chain amino acid transaminase [Candidatus Woesearchaeota archaeon]